MPEPDEVLPEVKKPLQVPDTCYHAACEAAAQTEVDVILRPHCEQLMQRLADQSEAAILRCQSLLLEIEKTLQSFQQRCKCCPTDADPKETAQPESQPSNEASSSSPPVVRASECQWPRPVTLPDASTDLGLVREQHRCQRLAFKVQRRAEREARRNEVPKTDEIP